MYYSIMKIIKQLNNNNIMNIITTLCHIYQTFGFMQENAFYSGATFKSMAKGCHYNCICFQLEVL